MQRVEAKDYLDVAWALYGQAFQPSECLKALVYFQGGDLDTLPGKTRVELIRSRHIGGRDKGSRLSDTGRN